MQAFMRNKRKWILTFVFFAALITATFYFLLKDSEIPSLIETIRRISPGYLLGGLLLMFLFVACEAVNTKGLLGTFGYRRGLLQCLKYSFIGFYFCSVTPSASGGQPAQVYYMNKDDVPVGVASLDMLLVTLSYQTGMLLIGGVLFLMKMPLILERVRVLQLFLIYGVLANLICIVGFVLVVFRKNLLSRAAAWCVHALFRIKLVRKPEETLKKLAAQMEEYERGAAYLQQNFHLLLRMFLITFVQLLSRLSITFLLYRAFGLTEFGYFDILALQAVLAIAVESLPLPGAMGATEAGYLAVNSLLFGPGLILPVMLVSRGISYYGFLLISGGVTVAAHLRLLLREHRKQAAE